MLEAKNSKVVGVRVICWFIRAIGGDHGPPLVFLFRSRPKFYPMYVIAVTECASFLLVYNTFISAALYIKKHNRWNKRCHCFCFFFPPPPFFFFILQSSLLSGHVTSTVVDVCSYSTLSGKKKRRWELSVHGPFVAFAALAVTQREGRCWNVAEIWWFLELFFFFFFCSFSACHFCRGT